MLRSSAARWSRWMSGTWSALVAANSTRSMCEPNSSLREDAAVAVAEAVEDGVEREPRILEGVAAGQQRAQHVDQHDLARIVAEVILVEARHRLALVDLEALLHQRAERVSGRKSSAPSRDLERREPEIGHVAEIARTQEAARLQMAQAVPVARRDEVGAIEIVRLLGGLLAGGFIGAVLGDEAPESRGAISARTPLRIGAARSRATTRRSFASAAAGRAAIRPG